MSDGKRRRVFEGESIGAKGDRAGEESEQDGVGAEGKHVTKSPSSTTALGVRVKCVSRGERFRGDGEGSGGRVFGRNS